MPVSLDGYNARTMTNPSTPPQTNSPRLALGCLVLLFIALFLILGPRLQLPNWRVPAGANTAFEEALAWKKGTMNLTQNTYEVAQVGDKHYNVVGPAFTLISLVAITLNNLIGGIHDEFYPTWYISVITLPPVIIGFWAFRRVTGSSPYAALFTAYLLIGTSMEPILRTCQQGSIYYINHALAVSGLLLMAGDLLGRRRLWPALIGLGLAAWSRQMTALYALPLLWITWRQCASSSRQNVLRRLAGPMIGLAIIAGLPMALSWIKFGNPFDSGYVLMYHGRTDPIARRAFQAVFSPRYIPMHLRAMNTAVPAWDIRGGALMPINDGRDGGAIWLTSPLLLAVFVTFRQWWRDPARRALMLGSLAVVVCLMCYHTTGSSEGGHYRYALDYIPVWLLVIAPYLTKHRTLSWVLAALAWSGVYFRLLP